ncbi:MAG TPA: hypothetical protein DIU15_19225, partial [Deltaproteobacteria bacterium]|nr:hypothetical protein [Deltaproteobacteria bacterium]
RGPDGDRKILVYDAGESGKLGNEAKHVIEPYLRKVVDDGPPGRPILEIDYLIPSHYHKDHTGSPRGDQGTGLFYLWDALNIRIGKLLDTGVDYDAAGAGDTAYRQWVKASGVERETLAFDQLGPDRQIDLGEDVWVEVLAVGATVEGRGRVVKDRWISTTSQNDFSAVLVIHYKKFDIYLGGDLSGYLHESWGAWYHSIEAATFPHLRPVEVYRVNHHGSQWSSSYAFLQRIRPEVGVISCGRGHKHPNEYTVHRLLGWEDYWSGRPMGSDIYQTKNDDGFRFEGPHPHTERTQTIAGGHIVVESDGLTGFTINIPGVDPIKYPLQGVRAMTDVPRTVKEARASQSPAVGGEADPGGRYPEVYDREDVDGGKLRVPQRDDPDGGGD